MTPIETPIVRRSLRRHGDDPAAYDEVFDQEGGADVADPTPLVEYLAFIDESDEATFAADLPERLGVEAFVTYLAMMDLVDNFDDIHTQLDELTERLFESGAAEAILAAWTTVVTEQASDLVDASTIEQEADAISRSIAE